MSAAKDKAEVIVKGDVTEVALPPITPTTSPWNDQLPMANNGGHVYTAINAVTKAMASEGIAKDRKNVGQGYMFRGIDQVYQALSGKLSEHRLCIIPKVKSITRVERETAKGGVMFYTTLHIDFDFVSAVDGSMHTASTIGEAMDSADKSTNKAMSAAYKYVCFQVFCIPVEGEPDADSDPNPEIVPDRVAPRVANPDADAKRILSDAGYSKEGFQLFKAEHGSLWIEAALGLKESVAAGFKVQNGGIPNQG